jgi:hypothetical protein
MCIGGQVPIIEEQVNEMEILGQPKQFKSGGIIDALRMTPNISNNFARNTANFLGSGGGFTDQVGGISSLANGGLVEASKRFFEQAPSFSNQGVAIEETVVTPIKPQGVLQSIKQTLDIDQPIDKVEEEVVLKKPMLPPVVQPSQQIGDAPETGNPTQQKLDGETLSNILGGIGSGLSLFTGGLSSLGGKAVSLFNQAFNPGSVLNTIRGSLTGDDNKQDPNLNLGYSSHPHTVSTPGYDEVTGFEASDSVDIGGSDPGVDAMGQATGQEMGEEDDDNSMDGAWT